MLMRWLLVLIIVLVLLAMVARVIQFGISLLLLLVVGAALVAVVLTGAGSFFRGRGG